MSDRKERNRADLDVLFSPRSIAIVGASPDRGRVGGQPLHFLRTFGYGNRGWNCRHVSVRARKRHDRAARRRR